MLPFSKLCYHSANYATIQHNVKKHTVNCTLQVSYKVVLINPLARLTSRCRRMKTIVSLERGVCSCAKLQVWASNAFITHPILRILPRRTTTCSLDRKKKQLKGRHFSSDAEVIAAAKTWLDGQYSEFF